MGREGEHSQNVGWTRLPPRSRPCTLAMHPPRGLTLHKDTQAWYVECHKPPWQSNLSFGRGHWHQASQVVSLFPSLGTQETDKEESALFSAHSDGCMLSFSHWETQSRNNKESPPFTNPTLIYFSQLVEVVGFFACLVSIFSFLCRNQFFPLYFQVPCLPAWRNLFSSSGIIHRGRYQPACHHF
jgi:hypothetical protein